MASVFPALWNVSLGIKLLETAESMNNPGWLHQIEKIITLFLYGPSPKACCRCERLCWQNCSKHSPATLYKHLLLTAATPAHHRLWLSGSWIPHTLCLFVSTFSSTKSAPCLPLTTSGSNYKACLLLAGEFFPRKREPGNTWLQLRSLLRSATNVMTPHLGSQQPYQQETSLCS